MLAPSASVESGIAILDKNDELILLDKLFTMQDIQHFFDNFPSLKNSKVCISLPWDNSMLNGKWKVLSKAYQPLALNNNLKNIDNWTQRYSSRGCDYFNFLLQEGIDISRFELYLTRQALNLNSYFKERSPADCKALQNALKIEYGFNSLFSNMMPMALLEAIVGAILAKQNVKQKEEMLFNFNGLPVIRK